VGWLAKPVIRIHFLMRLAILAMIPALAATARATTCPAPFEGPLLDGQDVEARLSFLVGALTENARRLNAWSLGWGTTYAVATAAQVTAIPLVHGGVRIDLSAGAIAAGIGSAALYLLPLQITGAARFSDAELDDPDRCQILAQVERRFFESAEIDRLSASWLAHAGNLAINAALALVLGLGYGRWTSAAISAAVGLSVGEANLWTQPHGLVSAEKRYLDGDLGEGSPAAGWQIIPSLGASFAGATIVFSL
jgi:hypothetical protein